MPLSQPESREIIHTRQIKSYGFKRKDGLWDIEAHLTDTKAYEFSNSWRGTVNAGEPIHDMWIRHTLDDDLCIRGIEANSDSTPYELCPKVTKNFKNLVGIKIAPGWNREVKKRVGGIQGCTHLVELLGVMATVAFQTIFSLREEDIMASSDKKPPMLNSCHAWAENSPVVKEQYPSWYKER